MPPERRPRLTPPIADIRRAVRASLRDLAEGDLVLVALSGGSDSLALAAGVAFEATRLGLRAGAVIVDHGLQDASAAVAARAAAQARTLGLDPVEVVPAEWGAARRDGSHVVIAGGAFPADQRPQRHGDAPAGTRGEGPEAAARAARYGALSLAARRLAASAIVVGHTLDDQAESVLLGLARGSGASSLQGMAPSTTLTGVTVLRPLLGIRRAQTRQACADAGLDPWDDPHNTSPEFARVRVRERVLPVLESELGPGIAEALARTAEQLREDAEAFDGMIDEFIEEICEPAEAGISVEVGALAANPAAIRQRIIRHVVTSEFGVSLTRAQTLEIARLVTDWHGQKPLHLPGIRVGRDSGRIVFQAV